MCDTKVFLWRALCGVGGPIVVTYCGSLCPRTDRRVEAHRAPPHYGLLKPLQWNVGNALEVLEKNFHGLFTSGPRGQNVSPSATYHAVNEHLPNSKAGRRPHRDQHAGGSEGAKLAKPGREIASRNKNTRNETFPIFPPRSKRKVGGDSIKASRTLCRSFSWGDSVISSLITVVEASLPVGHPKCTSPKPRIGAST